MASGKFPLNLVEISDDLMCPEYSEITGHDASRPVSDLLSVYLELIAAFCVHYSRQLSMSFLYAFETCKRKYAAVSSCGIMGG